MVKLCTVLLWQQQHTVCDIGINHAFNGKWLNHDPIPNLEILCVRLEVLPYLLPPFHVLLQALSIVIVWSEN